MYSSCIKESADVPSANIDQTMFAPDSVAQTFRKAACGFVDDSLFVDTKGALSGSINEDGSRLSYIIAIYNSQGKLETSVVDPVSGVPGGLSGFTYPHVFVWNSSKSKFEDKLGESSSIKFWGYEDDTYTVLVLGNLRGSRAELESFASTFFSSNKNLSTVLAQSLDMQDQNMFSISNLESFQRLPSSAVKSGYEFTGSSVVQTSKFYKKYRIRFYKDINSNYVGDSIDLDDVFVNQSARYVYPFNTTTATSAVITGDNLNTYADRFEDGELGFNSSPVTINNKLRLATDYVDIWVPRNIQGKNYTSINSADKRQRSYLESNGYSQLASRASSIKGTVNSTDGLYDKYSFEFYLYENDGTYSNFNVNESTDIQWIDFPLTKEYLTTSGDSSKRTIKYHWSNGNENSPGSFKTDVISTSGVRCSDVLVIDKFFCDDPSTQLTFKLDAKPSSGSRINGTAKSFSSVQSSSLGGPNSRIGFALPSGSSNVKLINNNKKASLVVNYSGFLTSMDPNEVWYLTVSDGVADPVEIPLAAPWKLPVLSANLDDLYVAQKPLLSLNFEGLFRLRNGNSDVMSISAASISSSSGSNACTSAYLKLQDSGTFTLRVYSSDMVFYKDYPFTIKDPYMYFSGSSSSVSYTPAYKNTTSHLVVYSFTHYMDDAYNTLRPWFGDASGNQLTFDSELESIYLIPTYNWTLSGNFSSYFNGVKQSDNSLKVNLKTLKYNSIYVWNSSSTCSVSCYPSYMSSKISSTNYNTRLTFNVINPLSELSTNDIIIDNYYYISGIAPSVYKGSPNVVVRVKNTSSVSIRSRTNVASYITWTKSSVSNGVQLTPSLTSTSTNHGISYLSFNINYTSSYGSASSRITSDEIKNGSSSSYYNGYPVKVYLYGAVALLMPYFSITNAVGSSVYVSDIYVGPYYYTHPSVPVASRHAFVNNFYNAIPYLKNGCVSIKYYNSYGNIWTDWQAEDLDVIMNSDGTYLFGNSKCARYHYFMSGSYRLYKAAASNSYGSKTYNGINLLSLGLLGERVWKHYNRVFNSGDYVTLSKYFTHYKPSSSLCVPTVSIEEGDEDHAPWFKSGIELGYEFNTSIGTQVQAYCFETDSWKHVKLAKGSCHVYFLSGDPYFGILDCLDYSPEYLFNTCSPTTNYLVATHDLGPGVNGWAGQITNFNYFSFKNNTQVVE